jgi:hypothetical protein
MLSKKNSISWVCSFIKKDQNLHQSKIIEKGGGISGIICCGKCSDCGGIGSGRPFLWQITGVVFSNLKYGEDYNGTKKIWMEF